MPLAKIADLNGPPEEVSRMIGVARSLSKMYEAFLEEFPGDSHERAPGIHASELNKCLRQVFYSLTKAEKREKIAPIWRKRFETGHAVHGMVQSHLKRMAKAAAKNYAEGLAQENGWTLEFEDEVKVAPHLQELAAHYMIQSSCDGVFTFRDANGEPVLRVGLEIKTESPDGYDKLREPKEDHVSQVHLYMACLDLPLVWFFYFNKGNQNNTPSQFPWLIPFNPVHWTRLEERAKTALEHYRTQSLPVKEEGMYCEFCPYSWTCQPARLASKVKNYSKMTPRRPGS